MSRAKALRDTTGRLWNCPLETLSRYQYVNGVKSPSSLVRHLGCSMRGWHDDDDAHDRLRFASRFALLRDTEY